MHPTARPDTGHGKTLVHRRMRARDVDEAHRGATPLELFFDVTFVAAVAQLAGGLAHAHLEGHTLEAVGPFLMVFFAIWWAWMNFTWFASAYDCDDAPYRLATLVQMGGVVVLAAGTGRAFDHGDFTAVTVGYLIMRIGMLSLWLRAAVQHPASRPASWRYSAGVALLEVLWVSRLLLGEDQTALTFVVLVLLELLVPVLAERGAPTSWHPDHIVERYALFTIILLAEGVLAATTALAVVVEAAAGPRLVVVAGSELVIVAALWWLYFARPAGAGLRTRRGWSFAWGYGHYLLFAAMAALAGGLEAAVVVAARVGDPGGLGDRAAVATVAVPVAVVVAIIDLTRVPAPGDRPRVELRTAAALAAWASVVSVADVIGLTLGLVAVAAVSVGLVLAVDLDPRHVGAAGRAPRLSGR